MTTSETILLGAALAAIVTVMAGAVFYMRAHNGGWSLRSWFPDDAPPLPAVSQIEAEALRHRLVATAALLAAAALLIKLIKALRRRHARPAALPPHH